jgi:hypothetical protein
MIKRWLAWLRNAWTPKPEIDMETKQEAERRRSMIMARLRSLEIQYEAATRSEPDVD